MNASFLLNSGHNIPLIGCELSLTSVNRVLCWFSLIFLSMFTFGSVGTFQIRTAELIYAVLDHALAAGYRHIGKHRPAMRLLSRWWIIELGENFILVNTSHQTFMMMHSCSPLHRLGSGVQERTTHWRGSENPVAQVPSAKGRRFYHNQTEWVYDSCLLQGDTAKSRHRVCCGMAQRKKMGMGVWFAWRWCHSKSLSPTKRLENSFMMNGIFSIPCHVI